MPYNFDRLIERRNTNSIKWKLYPQDVLPLWVADMDFAAPESVLAALRTQVEHGILGYEFPTPQLTETVAARMESLYGWQVSPDAVVATPGVIAGFSAAARTVCQPGQGLLVQPPVYPPFLKLHENVGLVRQDAPLTLNMKNRSLRYSVDFDRHVPALQSTQPHRADVLTCRPVPHGGDLFEERDCHLLR